ncbi:MAG TPA: hypothetical protein VME40_07440 [Caulobacteraceae bacterium]|nr:hypothetical protein [Caulobacteraceae bacterium]
MTPEAFEALLRRELKARDAQRRSRIGDQAARDAADGAFVNAVMQAAGLGTSEGAEQAVREGARMRRLNEAAAFGDE